MGFFGRPNVERLGARRDTRGLVKALGYIKSPAVRRSAAVALGETGGEAAIEALTGSLDDDDLGAREATVRALVRIGAPAVESLCEIVDLPRRATRSQVKKLAAEALGEIGDPDSLGSLLMACSTGYGDVRPFFDAVLKIAAADLEGLMRYVADERVSRHTAAAKALGMIGDERAVDALMQTIERGAAGRLKAQDALVKIGAAAVDPLIASLGHREQTVRRAAIEVLGRIGDARATDPVVSIFRGTQGVERDAAVRTLERLGWKPDLPDDEAVYWGILREWKKLAAVGSAAAERLIAVSDREAYRAVVEMGSPAVDALLASLGTPSPGTRYRAVDALKEIGWRPEADSERAAYWMAEATAKRGTTREKLEQILRLDHETVAPLLLESLDWHWFWEWPGEYDPRPLSDRAAMLRDQAREERERIEWECRGRIAVTLVEHGLEASDQRLAGIIEGLERFASLPDETVRVLIPGDRVDCVEDVFVSHSKERTVARSLLGRIDIDRTGTNGEEP